MIYARIKELAKKNKISINKLEFKIGISKGSLCKIDKHEPSADTIRKLAKELHTTEKFLMTGEDTRIDVPEYNPETIELIELFSKINKEQQNVVMSLLRSIAPKE